MFMEQVHFHFEDELNPVCQDTVMQKYTIQSHIRKSCHFTGIYFVLYDPNFLQKNCF